MHVVLGWGGSYNTDQVTGWGGDTTHTMWCAVLYVCGVGLGWDYNSGHVTGWVEIQHRPCDVLSCMSVGWGGVGWWGGITTQTILTCCPVCLWCWGGVEIHHRPCDGVGCRYKHRPCEVLSCMSAVLRWGGVTTHTMWRGWGGEDTTQIMWCAVLYVCCVGVGWSYNTYHMTGWGGVTTHTMLRGGVELQHIPCDGVGWRYNTPCDVRSCMSVVLGWSGVTTQTMWRALLYVCGVGVAWSYNTPSDVLSSMPVGWSGVGLQHTMWCAVLYLCGVRVGWGYTKDHVMGWLEIQHRPCDVLSSICVGLGWDGVTTQTMWRTVLYICGFGGGLGLQDRPCDVLSCMSVGLGRVGVTRQTMWCVVLYVCGVGAGWGYKTDHVMCCPVCLWGWGGLGLTRQTMWCVVLYVCGIGSGVELQHIHLWHAVQYVCRVEVGWRYN